MDIDEYFQEIEKKTKNAYELAEKARKKGRDPESKVDIPLAKNIFERVEGLIGAIKPEIINSGLVERLKELDDTHGSGDWRVALIISEEVAKGKFCEFKDDKEAIEIGIRVGLAYMTMGVVSAPLEGFIEFRIKERQDGKKYGSCYFAGPIRAAGGTAAAVTLIIADYLRRKFKLEPFDITKEEIERNISEVESYHKVVARLQYFPKKEELEFLLNNVPLEINGDPTSRKEVLIYKDLSRIGTPMIRGGMCLVLCESLAQKAPKILKNIEKWGEEYELAEWAFLKEYLEIKSKLHTSEKKESSDEKIKPNNIYIREIVAGRPVFAYPMRKGGFRLRYGRSRLSGLAAAGVHPATTRILGDFIATGSQLRIERPGKACSTTPCTSIEGPVVKLWDESVVRINSEEDANKYRNKVKKILFLGDLLFAYGEFARNNHILVPSPYVEEWWVQDLAKATKGEFDLPEDLGPMQLADISIENKIPLHPNLTFFYSDITSEETLQLFETLKKSNIDESPDLKIIFEHNKNIKKILEDLCVPHSLIDNGIKIKGEAAVGILFAFGYLPDKKWPEEKPDISKKPLEMINSISCVKIKDKSGIYVGARLGRPEKAKHRKMKGRPHMLFPVASQGGRMRSMNEAIEKGFVESEFPNFKCPNCGCIDIFKKCEKCNVEGEIIKFCRKCERETTQEKHCGIDTVYYKKQKVDVREKMNSAIKNLNISLPNMVKGVRGTSNKTRISEPIEKGILRAIHNLYVNKDGTVRYDAIETPITHFKPKEVRTSIEKLRELGYEKDIYGEELRNENQILELFPQDVVLPDCKEWQDESALEIVYKTAAFVDDLLEKYYKVEKYYNIRSPNDMVGKLVIGLAPHTSAGMLGRIVGFSKTQCFFAHPYFHSAMRRNCVHPKTKLIISDENNKEIFSENIGDIVETLIKSGAKKKKKGDFYFIEAPEDWNVFSLNPKTHKKEKKKIKYFMKGSIPKEWVKIKTATGREFIMTPYHTLLYFKNNKLVSKKATDAVVGDNIPLISKFDLVTNNKKEINLIEEFLKSKNTKLKKEIRIINASNYFKNLVKKQGMKKIRRTINFSKQHSKTLSAWYKSVPLKDFKILIENNLADISELPFNTKLKLKQTQFKHKLKISNDLMRLLGYFISEGHARKNKWTHQISFRICNPDLFKDLLKCVKKVFGICPNISENKTKLNISRKIIYYIFTEVFKTGSNAKNKRVPRFIFNLDKEKLKHFISAYFDGDGSVSIQPDRLRFYSTSKSLLEDIGIVLSRFGILCRYQEAAPRLPGRKILQRYKKLKTEPKKFSLHHLVLSKKDIYMFSKICNPISKHKKQRIIGLSKKLEYNKRYTKANNKMHELKQFNDFTNDVIVFIERVKENEHSYCLDIFSDSNITSKNVLWGNQLFQIRCDGDEASFMLLMDGLLNFSRQYLPDRRGSRHMDAPLVLTTRLIPKEVDDEVFNMDICDIYPLEFYEATEKWKSPYDVKIKKIEDTLGTPAQYKNLLFTHPVEDMNKGNKVSSYKTLKSIFDKVKKQMELAEKIKAVNKANVAQIVIEKHFLKDIKGNLRRYSQQEFRCISCNQKYRRVPIAGKCHKCDGKLVLTVSEGTVSKYLQPSLNLAEKYFLPDYLKQTLDILKRRVESVFGKEPTKQTGLGKFMDD